MTLFMGAASALYFASSNLAASEGTGCIPRQFTQGKAINVAGQASNPGPVKRALKNRSKYTQRRDLPKEITS